MLKNLLGVSLLAMAALPLAAAAQDKPVTGDSHPSYVFAKTGETMAYRLYVPAGYDGSKPMPLVVMLHGAGGDENSTLGGPDGPAIARLAESHGFIVMAPRGYRGGYGDIYPVVVSRETAERSQRSKPGAGAPADGTARPRSEAPPPPPTAALDPDNYAEQPASQLQTGPLNELSELETLAAIADLRGKYKIDPARMYLVGNSMGGVGTAYLAAKYPTMWAAVAPSGGPLAAWSYPFFQLRNNKVAALYVHGEFDEHASAHWSEVVYKTAKAEGVDAQLLIVKRGSHGHAWIEALPQIFDFFAERHR